MVDFGNTFQSQAAAGKRSKQSMQVVRKSENGHNKTCSRPGNRKSMEMMWIPHRRMAMDQLKMFPLQQSLQLPVRAQGRMEPERRALQVNLVTADSGSGQPELAAVLPGRAVAGAVYGCADND